MTRIYLAGAMEYYRDKNYKDATSWRVNLRNGLVSCNDNYGTDFKVFDPTINEDERHDIVSQNTYYLDRSDLIVVNLKDIERSLGTLYELVYSYLHDIPIITIGSHFWTSHPYMKHMSSVNLKNVKEAVEFIGKVYGQ